MYGFGLADFPLLMFSRLESIPLSFIVVLSLPLLSLLLSLLLLGTRKKEGEEKSGCDRPLAGTAESTVL